jgi:NitT/TauT family transport system ATP-binding protein
LLLDEPFSSLDSFTTRVLLEELLKIWESKENRLTSIILISHDVSEVVEVASRIIMMDGNPGRVRFVKLNKLSRPRDRRSQEFLNMVDELHNAYFKEENIPHKEQHVFPLISVTPEEVLGILVHLQFTKDLYRVGVGNMDYFKRIMMSADAAELLKFIEIENRTGTLTPIGKRYLAADNRVKRDIWKGQLLQIPLFDRVVNSLKSAPGRSMSAKELESLIAHELPNNDAQEQCKILISWGTHGNLFSHHKNSRAITLS